MKLGEKEKLLRQVKHLEQLIFTTENALNEVRKEYSRINTTLRASADADAENAAQWQVEAVVEFHENEHYDSRKIQDNKEYVSYVKSLDLSADQKMYLLDPDLETEHSYLYFQFWLPQQSQD